MRACVRLCSCKEPLEIISGLIVTRPPLGRRDKRKRELGLQVFLERVATVVVRGEGKDLLLPCGSVDGPPDTAQGLPALVSLPPPPHVLLFFILASSPAALFFPLPQQHSFTSPIPWFQLCSISWWEYEALKFLSVFMYLSARNSYECLFP